MNKLFERLCEVRHLDSDFLYPKYENLSDPYLIPDMEKAVSRIKKAIKNQEKILIYGDYDVDGVTASTVMEQTLILAGINPTHLHIMLPDRFVDGYGMSPKLINFAQKEGITLVITVDCGSHNHKIIEELNQLKIDSIITDHHEVGTTLPDAIAVINPKRQDCGQKKLKNLAGVGVAFKFAEALVKEGIIENGQEKWLLDLVLIGTICDNMLLTDENRILGYYGIKVLAKTRRPGLKELIQKAGVKNLNSESIGFQIGPRLNAAGRLDTADLSLNLLRAQSMIEAAPLAETLEQLNKKRKNEQLLALKEIKQRGISHDSVIVEVGNWHEGILGIVAGHLVEDYQRPAFVFTKTSDGFLKGSGRSFGDFNLAAALDHLKDVIISGGVRLEQSSLADFREQLNRYYQSLNLENQTEFFKQQPDLDIEDLSELSLEFLDDLKLLEPFGIGNEEPVFRLNHAEIADIRRMGTEGQHLRLDVRDKKRRTLKLIAFYAPKDWLNLDYDAKIAPIVKLIENDFNGVKSVEARIIDINML